MILQDSAFEMNESLRTIVNLDALNGTWIEFPALPAHFLASKAQIHSFKASNDLLISAPSSHRILLLLCVSYPLSDPARSTSIN